MNKTMIKTAVIPGAIALAATLLSVCLPFNAIAAIGLVAVGGLLSIAALEYGRSEKRALR